MNYISASWALTVWRWKHTLERRAAGFTGLRMSEFPCKLKVQQVLFFLAPGNTIVGDTHTYTHTHTQTYPHLLDLLYVVDLICQAGAWSQMWGIAENKYFLNRKKTCCFQHWERVQLRPGQQTRAKWIKGPEGTDELSYCTEVIERNPKKDINFFSISCSC